MYCGLRRKTKHVQKKLREVRRCLKGALFYSNSVYFTFEFPARRLVHLTGTFNPSFVARFVLY
jgi:hypothetical protein